MERPSTTSVADQQAPSVERPSTTTVANQQALPVERPSSTAPPDLATLNAMWSLMQQPRVVTQAQTSTANRVQQLSAPSLVPQWTKSAPHTGFDKRRDSAASTA